MDNALSDLEMTRLCAEAMGLTHEWDDKAVWLKVDNFSQGCEAQFTHKRGHFFHWILRYEPLTNDAQAMALVKKMELLVSPCDEPGQPWWIATAADAQGLGHDLNRAIVECVAKLQAGRGK